MPQAFELQASVRFEAIADLSKTSDHKPHLVGAHVRSPLAGGVHSEVVGLTSLVDSRLDYGPDDIVFRLAGEKYKPV